MKKIWTVLVLMFIALALDTMAQVQKPVSGVAPYPYGMDYPGPIKFGSGGLNGGQYKMTNSYDGYSKTYYRNYFEMRNLVGGQTAWLDLELRIDRSDRWYVLAYRIAVLGAGSEIGTVYEIDDSTPGVTNLYSFDQARGYGWPTIASAREFNKAWTNSLRSWNITGEGSIKIRFQYTVGTNVQAFNFGQNCLAIDYLVLEMIPMPGDPINLRIRKPWPPDPRYPYDIGPFGELPKGFNISWTRSQETDINRPGTLRLWRNNVSLTSTNWRKWTNPPYYIFPIHTDLSGLFYNAYLGFGPSNGFLGLRPDP